MTTNVKLTKAQQQALEAFRFKDRMRQRSNGRWSTYPNGEFSSRTIWGLEARGLIVISRMGHTPSAQITSKGTAALKPPEGAETEGRS